MKLYELVLVLKPSLSESQRKKIVDSIKALLKDLKITKENEWGQKTLSYAIKRESTGYYIHWALESKNSIPLDFEKKIIANENVLRHLVLRTK